MRPQRALVPLLAVALLSTGANVSAQPLPVPVPGVEDIPTAVDLSSNLTLFGSAEPMGLQLYQVVGSYDLCEENKAPSPDKCRWERLEKGGPSTSFPVPIYAIAGKDLPDIFYLDVSSGQGTAALRPELGPGADIQEVAHIQMSPRVPAPGSAPEVAVGLAS